MSLNSLIKDDKVLREKIKNDFLRPKLNKNLPILVEPHTKNYGSVGTAFDYIFRFNLERINKTVNQQRWVAEAIFDYDIKEEDRRNVSRIIANVKHLRKAFLETGLLSQELIAETLRMTRIDNAFRVRDDKYLEDINRPVNPLDVKDITEQYALVDNDVFQAQNVCVLNPTFGKASTAVDGADADLIIDDMLVDLKSTKNLSFPLAEFCQIVGYFMLHKLGGPQNVEVKQLAIYYSRYGYLFSFKVEDMIDRDSLQAFSEWFAGRIGF